MDTPQTIFILGAGASYDFGFPTGEELLRDVHQVCKDIEAAIAAYLPRGYSWDVPNKVFITQQRVQFLNFEKLIRIFETKKLQDSDPHPLDSIKDMLARLKSGLPFAKSIDRFFYDNRGDATFVKFGKIVIAAAQLRAERYGLCKIDGKTRRDFIPLHHSRNENGREISSPPDFFELRKTWFMTLFRELRPHSGPTTSEKDIERFITRIREMGFITFNYDRSLEFLFRCAIEAYESNLTNTQKAELIDAFEGQIIRPYGSIASLDILPFAKDLSDVNDWNMFAENLCIFTEANQDMEQAQTWMENAWEAVFLGFGFNDKNLGYLGLYEDSDNTNFDAIYATAFGLPEHRREQIYQRLHERTAGYSAQSKGTSHTNTEGQRCYMISGNCKELLDEYAAQIF